MNFKKLRNIAIYCLFLLIVAEGSVRLFFWSSGRDIEIYRNYSFTRQPKIFANDNLLLHRLIPNVKRSATTSEYEVVYRINSVGIRDKEITPTPDKFRVLFLGDSQTFGEGVEEHERFSNLVEQNLEAVYTINAGVPGYGIHQMLSYLKYFGVKLKPDLVVFTLISGDLDRAAYGMLQTNKPNPPPSPHLVRSPEEFEKLQSRDIEGLQHSYLYSFARVQLKLLMLRRWIEARDKQVWQDIHKSGESGIQITSKEQKQIVMDVSRGYFEEYAELLNGDRFEVAVVNIGREHLPWFEEYLAQKNIRYVDFVEQLSRDSKFYFEIDRHFSKHGHKEVSRLLTDFLSEEYELKRAKVP